MGSKNWRSQIQSSAFSAVSCVTWALASTFEISVLVPVGEEVGTTTV